MFPFTGVPRTVIDSVVGTAPEYSPEVTPALSADEAPVAAALGAGVGAGALGAGALVGGPESDARSVIAMGQ